MYESDHQRAAHHERVAVIDELLAAGVPIDAEDGVFGRQALRLAVSAGRARSVAQLLARAANPHHRDPRRQRTALFWVRRADPRNPEVEALVVAAQSGNQPESSEPGSSA